MKKWLIIGGTISVSSIAAYYALDKIVTVAFVAGYNRAIIDNAVMSLCILS